MSLSEWNTSHENDRFGTYTRLQHSTILRDTIRIRFRYIPYWNEPFFNRFSSCSKFSFLIKWVSFFLFILMTYHSILSVLREMYVNNRLLFVGLLYTHKMTYIRFHTHPEYTIMTSWTNQLRCRQLKKKRCTGTSKSKMAANHMNYKIKLAAAGVSGELLDWFEFNNSNNNFMNLFKKAFQLNLQCQISKT